MPVVMADDTETVLSHPTVAELIAVLQAFPADAPVRIDDADTHWTINTIHVGPSPLDRWKGAAPVPGTVWLWGNYGEMEP